jgi:hypothetical protein
MQPLKNNNYIQMKKYIILHISLLVILFASCKKEEVRDLDFEVTTELPAAWIYTIKDSVKFNVSGNPDVIYFYSGENGYNYDFRDRTSRNDGSLKLSFQIRVDNADGFAALASGNFKVVASTNFTGIYSTSPDLNVATSADSATLNKANWVDITNRFTIPTSGTPSLFYNSGEATINDLITNPNNPIYIAFLYKGNATGALGANGITIGSLSFYNKYTDGTQVNYNLVPGGTVSTVWKIVKAANTLNSWATSSTQLKFTSTLTASYSEDLAISNAFYPNLALPDKAVPIKNVTNSPITQYRYRFTKPGDYKVVFVASNNGASNQKVKIKTFVITVNP